MGSGTIVVTGMGAVSALGIGCEALWDGVARGRDGIRAIQRFSTEEYGVHIAAVVPGHDGALDMQDQAEVDALCLRFGVLAAREAWDAARTEGTVPPHRVGIVLGTSPVGANPVVHRLVEKIAEALGAQGPLVTISTACASSTNAVGLGRDLLRSGDCDVVLAGGVDVLTDILFAGFHALSALSETKCAPFSSSIGTSLGEGAGFLALERREHAAARGAAELATLLGYGLASDAYHETSPDPKGSGVSSALRSALADSGLSSDRIGYANLHGTGTAANDPAEWAGYRRVFADGVATLPASSSKSFLGHAQGAAGVLELIVTLSAMRRGVVPPTLHLSERRRGVPDDPVADPVPRPHAFEAAIKTSAAFGGANAAVVVGRPGMEQPSSPPRRPVWLLGTASVGLGRGADEDLGALLPRSDPRGMGGASRWLTMAAALALRDGGIEVRGALRERTGLVAAITRPPADSQRELVKSARERGLPRLSASAFARVVLVAPAGACCRHLSLKGPLSALTTGAGSELVALAYAAELLAGRADADLMLAGGVHEADGDDRVSKPRDGAAVVLLGAGEPPAAAAIRVSGWSIGPPGCTIAASEAALERAGVSAATRFDPRDGEASAVGASWAGALARATAALRRGTADAALLCSVDGRSASVALVLKREEHGGRGPEDVHREA